MDSGYITRSMLMLPKSLYFFTLSFHLSGSALMSDLPSPHPLTTIRITDCFGEGTITPYSYNPT